MARSVGAEALEALGQQVVVDNRPGAGGRLGTELAAKAAPDGYTLIMGNAGSHAINSALYKDLPYDIERDFVPVTQVMRAPNVLVVNAVAAGEFGQGADRALQGESRQVQLRLRRQRQLGASVGGAVQVDGRRRRGARAVQGRHARADRSDRRTGGDVHGQPSARDRAHQVGPRESTGGDDLATLRRSFPTFRPSPNRGCPASRPWPGSACSRRPARRRRSCSGWRTRRRRSSSGRRSGRRSRDWAVSRSATRRRRSRRSSRGDLAKWRKVVSEANVAWIDVGEGSDAVTAPTIDCRPNGPYLVEGADEVCTTRAAGSCSLADAASSRFAGAAVSANKAVLRWHAPQERLLDANASADAPPDRRDEYGTGTITIHDNRGICALTRASAPIGPGERVQDTASEPWIDRVGRGPPRRSRDRARVPVRRVELFARRREAAHPERLSPRSPSRRTGLMPSSGSQLRNAELPVNVARGAHWLCRCGQSKH